MEATLFSSGTPNMFPELKNFTYPYNISLRKINQTKGLGLIPQKNPLLNATTLKTVHTIEKSQYFGEGRHIMGTFKRRKAILASQALESDSFSRWYQDKLVSEWREEKYLWKEQPDPKLCVTGGVEVCDKWGEGMHATGHTQSPTSQMCMSSEFKPRTFMLGDDSANHWTTM